MKETIFLNSKYKCFNIKFNLLNNSLNISIFLKINPPPLDKIYKKNIFILDNIVEKTFLSSIISKFILLENNNIKVFVMASKSNLFSILISTLLLILLSLLSLSLIL